LRNRGYSAGHGESDNFFARGSSGGRRTLPLLARLQSVEVKTDLFLSVIERSKCVIQNTTFLARDS
jgi:hypothetical protein